ncbi:AAA-like domain-containing protein [Nostoc sp. CHAB 5784]|uniref:AAA-like domain-containing protein n=1 Tax=Nostoc mirabile TaxID=2907820 RepID=UPI001E54C79A|nr:AAA-like domain-containing protein [Nostoc mirabile]MCC5665367.1 AAA-like domain-containing protein [Nostoc mirabile CHAB5784]
MFLNSPNPFFPGDSVPSEKFIGRNSIIQTAFDQIYNRGHLAVWGGLGTGKTSLLAKLAAAQTWEQNRQDISFAVIVRFSCEEISPFTDSGFWTKLLCLVRNNLDTEAELQEQVNTLIEEGRASQDSLRQILRELDTKGKYLVLLIDDYDFALSPNQQYSEENMQQFLGEFRSLAVYTGTGQRRNLSVIVTSQKRLNDIRPSTNPNQSPWYNHYLFRQLKPFDNNEVDQLLQFFNRAITPQLREALEQIAGGHPKLLQTACFLLYQELRNENQPSIEEYVKNFIREFESSTDPFFDSLWRRCDKKEQYLLMLMVLSKLRGRLSQDRQYDITNIESIFSQYDKILRNLQEQCIIKNSANTGDNSFIFISSIMENWVIQEIWNSNDESLQERQKAFLNLMSHQQIEDVKGAIVWVKRNQPSITLSFKFVYPIVERIIRFLLGS